MSPSESRNGRQTDSIPEGGILAALPRARPQRVSARRAAARTNAATKGEATAPKADTARTKRVRRAPAKRPVAAENPAATEKPIAAKKPKARKPIAAKKPKARKPVAAKKATSTKEHAAKPIAKPAETPAPKQGYEPEEELELGKTVNPPSGAELAESVADIIGELANSGLTAGGRLLKDAFSLLRRP
jgi:hypothetical protein